MGVADTTALGAIVPSARTDKMICAVANSGAPQLWMYDASSSATAGATVVTPADNPSAGRWLLQQGAASTSGNASGNGSSAVEIGVPIVLRRIFTAGAGGSADDVILYDAAAPFKFRVLDAFAVVTTGVAASTLTVRDAKAAGGNALTNAMASATSGATVRSAVTTATTTIASGGTLVVRRSDSGVAGEVIILAIREA
jgi:hypothetical protein